MFSKMVLRSLYHHVCIKQDDIYKIDLCTRYGHYEFVVVPFGLTNAPTSFMCFFNNVLHPYLDNFMIVFIDEEHVEHLVAVLRFLRASIFCQA